MTTQAELLAIAEKHKENPAVSILLGAIRSSQSSASGSLDALQAAIVTLRSAVNLAEGYSVPLDASDMTKYATKASASMAVMANDLFNLAALLQALGESIDY